MIEAFPDLKVKDKKHEVLQDYQLIFELHLYPFKVRSHLPEIFKLGISTHINVILLILCKYELIPSFDH